MKSKMSAKPENPIMKRLSILLVAGLCIGALQAADLQISRSVRHWEFMSASGPHSAVLGTETGRFEAWVYPLKLLRDFELEFRLRGREIPAEAVVRSVIYRPESTTLVYSGDYYAEHFTVRQTFVAPRELKGILIRLQVDTTSELEIGAAFTRDFALMWPAGLDSSFGSWDESLGAFVMGEEGRRFHGIVGSPGAGLKSLDYSTNYSASSRSSLMLGNFSGTGERLIAIAASFESRENLVETYLKLTSDPDALIERTRRSYADYLARTVRLELPDSRLQEAYDWSLISMYKGLTENEFLGGRGLVAGFGLSKGAPRPGFAWFFGRDTFWSCLALTAAGDFETAREGISFIARFQREDGKIPHEIAQSASFIPWFEKYPYTYASADSTPLFIIAVRDYIEASGDRNFLAENWERLKKAHSFMESTYDREGFPKNEGVGHGWIEGGPLLPVRTEFYQAGLAVEALRSLGKLARLMGDENRSAALYAESEAKRGRLNQRYWLGEQQRYALAVDLQGRLVDEPSILATVPMWFDLLDDEKARTMNRELAREEHLSDWGSRIISRRSPNFGPAGYHFGTVWPLFSGWASMGQYRYRQPDPGYANLMANALLALDGSGGHTTEVVNGAVYSPLSTSSPHQIWSAAMIVSPLLRGLLGVEVDATERRLIFRPQIPADWSRFAIRRIPVGDARLNLEFSRTSDGLSVSLLNESEESFSLNPFEPPVPVGGEIVEVRPTPASTSNQKAAGRVRGPVRTDYTIPPGESRIGIVYRNVTDVSAPAELPQFGAMSSNIRILGKRHDLEGGWMEIDVSGIAGRSYELAVFGGDSIDSVQGGVLSDSRGSIAMRMREDPGGGYVFKTIRLILGRQRDP